MTKSRHGLGSGALIVALAATMVMLASTAAFAHRLGRMTGGGRINTPVGKVTHGFELYCITRDGGQTVDVGPNNLQVNWSGARWHLEQITKGACHDEKWDPGKPNADFDAYYGEGFGRLNGESDAFACWRLTDNGEPGKTDLFRFRVWAPGEAPNPDNSATDGSKCPRPDSDPVIDTGTRQLFGGNHQAHMVRGSKARAG